jgi:hypothetical protein
MAQIIQTLWTHGSLSIMEKLSLCSFVKNGHEVHLYTYDEVQGVPEGVKVLDGEGIVKRSEYDYKHFINNGTFADYFRYKLLLEKGGWWVDTDLICLKQFDFSEDYVFSSMGTHPIEKEPEPPQRPLRAPRRTAPVVMHKVYAPSVYNNCMKSPAGSEVMQEMWDTCKRYDPAKVQWSEDVGPGLLDRVVKKCGLGSYVKSVDTFNPVDYTQVRSIVDPTYRWVFNERAYAVHLWNDLWNGRTNWKDQQTWEITGCKPVIQDKHKVVPGSLYGDLCARYL